MTRQDSFFHVAVLAAIALVTVAFLYATLPGVSWPS